MWRALRFAILLVLALAALTWVAGRLVDDTIRQWFEKDVVLRSHLALSGSQRALAAHWRDRDWSDLHALLTDVSRDERIMSAAACSTDLQIVTATPDYPRDFKCSEFAPHVIPGQGAPWQEWNETRTLPGGSVHISALPVIDEQGTALGFLVLLHDLSFVERREATTRTFILLAFGILALAASIVTVVAGRLSWRRWSDELRSLLSGGGEKPEFAPIVQDVRALVERLALENDLEGGNGAWTPQRLKSTLARYLQGEKIVIVANREPYIHDRAADGSIQVLHPASGLVTALEPVMRACSGVWVAHGGGTADRETADSRGRVRVPPGEESYWVRRVWLSREEERGYYYGFANEGLWPLCHIAHARPLFRIEDFRHYEEVNRRFADAACSEVDSEDPIILVQDYHFALVPKMIRERLPRATVLTFWHIPWPNAEQFGICPWRDELLEGLLGSSIIGFHIPLHCNNFISAVDRYLEARVDHEQDSVTCHGHTSLVRPYPISIDWPNSWATTTPPVAECRASVIAELGLRDDALIGIGVDRLDYTKGIEERLLAVERLLEKEPSLRGRFTFVQLAAPSRTIIDKYRQLNEAVESLAARINARFGKGTYRPVVLRRAHHEPPTVFRYYRAADVCYVSSLHDGMNLVAKEFVAARDDEQGTLVLSHFTGAARELTEALIVNPYDLEQASAALSTALHMPAREQRERMRSMRALVSEFNVYRWAGRMLVDAARVRRRDRLSGRLAEGVYKLEGAA